MEHGPGCSIVYNEHVAMTTSFRVTVIMVTYFSLQECNNNMLYLIFATWDEVQYWVQTEDCLIIIVLNWFNKHYYLSLNYNPTINIHNGRNKLNWVMCKTCYMLQTHHIYLFRKWVQHKHFLIKLTVFRHFIFQWPCLPYLNGCDWNILASVTYNTLD